jgi:hypothetical protein
MERDISVHRYFSEYLNTLKAYYIHLLKGGDTINHENLILLFQIN